MKLVMNMNPVIDPAVVRAFDVALFNWAGIVLVAFLLWGFVRWIFWLLDEQRDHSLQWKELILEQLGSIFLLRGVGESSKERIILWWGLGFLWILDGILQAQPAMPNNGFVEDVLAPALQGQPAWYIPVLGWNIQFWSDHPIGADVFATLVQVGIGILLVVAMDRFLGRLGLWISIAWGFGIWVLGEGMGGIFTGRATWLTGSPGSVVFYIWGAVLLLLPKIWWMNGRVARIGRRGIGIFWLAAAAVQAWPGEHFWSSSGLLAPFATAASMPQPSILASPIYAMADFAATQPVLLNSIFVAVMIFLGFAFLLNDVNRVVIGLMAVWLGFSWWMGQDFGVMGGIGTDPNSAPVFALLMIVVWRNQERFTPHSQTLEVPEL